MAAPALLLIASRMFSRRCVRHEVRQAAEGAPGEAGGDALARERNGGASRAACTARPRAPRGARPHAALLVCHKRNSSSTVCFSSRCRGASASRDSARVPLVALLHELLARVLELLHVLFRAAAFRARIRARSRLSSAPPPRSTRPPRRADAAAAARIQRVVPAFMSSGGNGMVNPVMGFVTPGTGGVWLRAERCRRT